MESWRDAPGVLTGVSCFLHDLRPPGRGRRVRYGKLRFPSCTPFHPPGTPLPWLSHPLFATRLRLRLSPCPQRAAPLPSEWMVERGAACTPFCFLWKSFEPTERCAEVEAVKGRVVARKFAQGRREMEPEAAVRVAKRAKGRPTLEAPRLGRRCVSRREITRCLARKGVML